MAKRFGLFRPDRLQAKAVVSAPSFATDSSCVIGVAVLGAVLFACLWNTSASSYEDGKEG